MSGSDPRGTFRFGTIDFTIIRRAELTHLVRTWSSSPRSIIVTLTGAHGMSESLRDEAVQRAHDRADYVLCDGTPPYVGAVLMGLRRRVDRIPGMYAMLDIAGCASRLGIVQALIGGPPGLAEMTRTGLERRLGRRLEAVTWSPPFTAQVDDEFVEIVAARILAMRPPVVVWLGLSTPKQELLAASLRERLPHGYLFGCVGAAFDVWAGTLPPPPRIVSRLGLAWAYRWVREPRRLTRRYLRAMPVVGGALLGSALRSLRARSGATAGE